MAVPEIVINGIKPLCGNIRVCHKIGMSVESAQSQQMAMLPPSPPSGRQEGPPPRHFPREHFADCMQMGGAFGFYPVFMSFLIQTFAHHLLDLFAGFQPLVQGRAFLLQSGHILTLSRLARRASRRLRLGLFWLGDCGQREPCLWLCPLMAAMNAPVHASPDFLRKRLQALHILRCGKGRMGCCGDLACRGDLRGRITGRIGRCQTGLRPLL